jgi:hypothetical protein
MKAKAKDPKINRTQERKKMNSNGDAAVPSGRITGAIDVFARTTNAYPRKNSCPISKRRRRTG